MLLALLKGARQAHHIALPQKRVQLHVHMSELLESLTLS